MVKRSAALPRMLRWCVVVAGGAIVCGVIALWAWRAFADPKSYDFLLAYWGGSITWATGHPETWYSWTGTPFLAESMAMTTRVWHVTTASRVLTGLNVAIVVGTIAVVVAKLRTVLSPAWLFVVALGLAGFAPVFSTIWWKQFNLIALVLALGGFAALRRDRVPLGGALIGLSIAIKPLVFLLPFVLLARRSTRVAGIVSLGSAVGFTVAAQGLIAANVHRLSALNVLTSLENFSDKSKPVHGLSCSPLNFSPAATVCRVVGKQHWTLIEFGVWIALALLAVWVTRALRGYDTGSWEAYAFTCVFSILASPISWSHYEVMLAPMLVLLVVRFTTVRTEAIFWVGVVVTYALASLVWSPYGTLIDAVQLRLPDVYQSNPHPLVPDVAQFASYAVLVTATLWYRRHGRDVEPGAWPSRSEHRTTPASDATTDAQKVERVAI